VYLPRVVELFVPVHLVNRDQVLLQRELHLNGPTRFPLVNLALIIFTMNSQTTFTTDSVNVILLELVLFVLGLTKDFINKWIHSKRCLAPVKLKYIPTTLPFHLPKFPFKFLGVPFNCRGEGRTLGEGEIPQLTGFL